MMTGAIVDTVRAKLKRGPIYRNNNEAHLVPGRGTEHGIYQAAQEIYLEPWWLQFETG